MSSTRASGRTRTNSRADALARLAADRNKKKRRSDMMDFDKEDDDLFDKLTEAEYAKLVEQRRADADFVVDDGGGDWGYADDGEEHWDMSGRKGNRQDRKHDPRRGMRRTGKKPLAPTQVEKVSNLFLGGAKRYIGPQSSKESISFQGKNGGEDLLDDLLADLQKDPLNSGEAAAAEAAANALKAANNKKSLQDVAVFGAAVDMRDALGNLDNYAVENYGDSTATDADGDVVMRAGQQGDHIHQSLSGEIDMSFDLDDDMFYGDANSDSDEQEIGKNEQQGLMEKAALEKKKKKEVQMIEESDSGEEDEEEAGVKTVKPTDWFALEQQNKLYSQAAADALAAEAKNVSTGKISDLRTTDENELLFYWLDIYQVRNRPQQLYMFGKVMLPNGKTQSCCIQVENLERNVFVLARKYKLRDPKKPESVTDQHVKFSDCYQEVQNVLKNLGIKKFGVKPVQRKYCFQRATVHDYIAEDNKNKISRSEALRKFRSLEDQDKSIPYEAQYLKIAYSAKDRQIPRGLVGTTFSHMFGTHTNTQELFILKRELKGPAWLKIKNCVPVQTKASWCKHEFRLMNPKDISKQKADLPPPKLKVLSLSMQTILNAKERNEIVMVSGLIHNSINVDGPTANESELAAFTIATKLKDQVWPYDLQTTISKQKLPFQMVDSERILLSLLLAKLITIDPDVVLGHELQGYMLDLLVSRMSYHRSDGWSKLGRLKLQTIPRQSKDFSLVGSGLGCGRLMCDTMVSAKELVRETNYTLPHLAKSQLKMDNVTLVEPKEVPGKYGSTKSLLDLSARTCNQAYLQFAIMHKLVLLPLTLQLTTLTGNLWSRSLQAKRAERIEFLLLHEFHRNKFIIPEKYTNKERSKRQETLDKIRGHDDPDRHRKKASGRKAKAGYAGGLVLEPKKGFYDKFVLLLDFNSLYPSIIREFNICFTTIKHWEVTTPGDPAPLPDGSAPNGVLPRVIKRLLERRGQVKKMLKKERNPIKAKQLDIRQKALKLVANSMYGCLGFQNSRFFCEPLASLVTRQGRDTLQGTVELANNMGHPVIYGDTDSIMVYTDSLDLKQVTKIAHEVKQAVNRKYRILEIEIDGVYKNMLLLRKKKYAALSLVTGANGKKTFVKEVKGLDLVRRDWCMLSKDVGNYALDQILSIDKTREEVVNNIHTYLQQLKNDLEQLQVPLSKFIITKCLQRAPHEYKVKENMAHVMVAMKMLEEKQNVRPGHYIPYVVTEGADASYAKRARHPKDIKRSEGQLKVDVAWYLTSQVLPPLARLCEPIEETDAAQLADCLGLDPRRFHNFNNTRDANVDDDDVVLATHMDDAERFKTAERLRVTCPECLVAFQFPGVYQIPPEANSKSGDALLGATYAGSKSNLAQDKKLRVISGLECPSPECKGMISSLQAASSTSGYFMNLVSNKLREASRRYYDGWLVCNDASCNRRTRHISVGNDHCPNKSCTGLMVPEYSSADLFLQVQYLSSLFDVDRARVNMSVINKQRAKVPEGGTKLSQLEMAVHPHHERVFEEVFQHIERDWMRTSSYNYISLDSLFRSTFISSVQKSDTIQL